MSHNSWVRTLFLITKLEITFLWTKAKVLDKTEINNVIELHKAPPPVEQWYLTELRVGLTTC